METEDLKYRHILRFVGTTPWAILPSKLAAIMDLIRFKAEGGAYTPEEIQAAIGAVARPAQRGSGAVAVIPVYGTIVPHGGLMAEMSGAVSIDGITAAFRSAMQDSRISGILLEFDSPGGSVSGVDELSAEIFRTRGTKPVTAIASPMAASAAYYIATAADELVVTPSGEVGSIGVFAAHEDMSRMMDRLGVTTTLISAGKFKTEGNPYEPLSDEARAAIQDRVNEYYQMFVDAVGRNRGVASSKVQEGFGQGRVMGARQAVAMGMADRVATMDEVLQGMMRKMPMTPGHGPGRAESDDVRLLAQVSAARGRALTGY